MLTLYMIPPSLHSYAFASWSRRRKFRERSSTFSSTEVLLSTGTGISIPWGQGDLQKGGGVPPFSYVVLGH